MKIHAGQVSVRLPYYIKCSLCEDTLQSWNAEEVVSLANEIGWIYDYDSDLIYCPSCKIEKE